MGSSEGKEILHFQSLGNYEWPSSPTEAALRRLFGRFKHTFGKKNNQPFIADDKLQRATLSRLEDVAAPPACGPLMEELDSSLKDWVFETSPDQWLKLIVLPPCDENDIVGSWAKCNSHQLLEPPERSQLLSDTKGSKPDLSGEGVLVISNLERWFLRHCHGLYSIRVLLEELAKLERHCVIGCNSWAWAYLSNAVNAHMVFSDPITFQAYNAQRLYDWFSGLAKDDKKGSVTFRSVQSGDNIMALNDENELKNDYFKRLAAASLGIPWVAWRLWRRSIRMDSGIGKADEINTSHDEETLWVTALDEFTLPEGGDQTALLILHSLLIHSSLSVEELQYTLPLIAESNIIHALIKARFVEQKDNQIQCAPAAYPSIRNGLSAAGFSMDRL